jgi:ABC-type nitrate/sulfonate/bicarbonate transport system substrate-binding protein
MKRIVLIAVAVIAAIVLPLAACRKGLEKTATGKLVIKLAYATIPHASLVEVALDQGFFTTEGLDIRPMPFAFGKICLDSVLSGKADLATVAETPIVLSILAGKQVVISAVIETSDRNTAIVAGVDRGVKVPSDLVGKAIGVSLGTNGEYFLDTFLIARGIERRSVRIVDLQPDQMLASIRSGRIAATATWNPTLLSIKTALAEKARIFDGSDIYTENFCVVAESEFMAKNPAAIRGFLRALIRAEDFLARNPQKAVAIIGKYTDTADAAVIAELPFFTFRVGLDKPLLLALEDEARWVLRTRATNVRTMPNFLDNIASDDLYSVAPERVRYTR